MAEATNPKKLFFKSFRFLSQKRNTPPLQPRKENTMQILRDEVGATFVGVLTDAGVYKNTPDGMAGFLRFVEFLNK